MSDRASAPVSDSAAWSAKSTNRAFSAFAVTLLVAGVVFVLVEFGTLALVLKFRKRKGESDDELPAQTHGNTRLEIGWTIAPALILAVIGVLIFIGTTIMVRALGPSRPDGDGFELVDLGRVRQRVGDGQV